MQYQQEDGVLDILVLGPMGNNNPSKKENCLIIKEALESVLEKLTDSLLKASFRDFSVIAPEELKGNRIANEVFRQLDNADFVVIDMSSRGETKQSSPNVMYELALVHAMGLPFMLVTSSTDPIPFYVGQDRVLPINYSNIEQLEDTLQKSLSSFLDIESNQNFTDNVVAEFYSGAAIIDISAAAGLAAGYYDNFVSRVLRDGDGYLARSKGALTNLVTVIPNNLNNTVQQQLEDISNQLSDAGFKLECTELTNTEADIRGLAIRHVKNVIIDVPSTIFALRRSPRLLKHSQKIRPNQAQSIAEIKTHQRLLQQFKQSLQDQIRRDQINVQIRNTAFDCLTVSELTKRLSALVKDRR